MHPVQRIFVLALAFVVTLGASLGAFLFVSLWPYFSLIGKVTAGVVIVGLGCAASLMVSFTYNKIVSWNIRRRLVVFGEIGAYRERDGSWTHLSGIHQQMSLPAPNSVVVDEVQESSDETILELWGKGLSLRDIEKATGAKYHRIQKITSAAKNR